jgi:hypothetical protein
MGKKHGREEPPVDTPRIVTTRESNNKRRKLQQRTEKSETRTDLKYPRWLKKFATLRHP